MNPYDWQSHQPQVEIPHPDLAKVKRTLDEGGSAVVLGGHGMGKSAFLQQVAAALGQEDDMRVVIIPAPPAELDVRACLDHLTHALGVDAPGAFGTREIVDAYFARDDVPSRLVLLFDQFDRYAGDDPAAPPGRGFFHDLESTRRDMRGLGVLGAGSIGVYAMRDVLASGFLSRALHVTLRPFERIDLDKLARPFAERGEALGADVLDALYLASGGIPALVTHGLQQLWYLSAPAVERDVADIFADFLEEEDEYLHDHWQAISDPRFSTAPRRAWERIRDAGGDLARAELEEALGPCDEPLDLHLNDVLKLLQAAGLVRFDGSPLRSDPLAAHPIAGLLNLPLPSPEPAPEDLGQHLRRDLMTLVGRLNRSSADFFRPTGSWDLVSGTAVAVYLALGFDLLGWQLDRGARSHAGRTDLRVRRSGSPNVAVCDVKIWGRDDYDAAQDQVESRWTEEVQAGAVVQITDVEVENWAVAYQRECLESRGRDIEMEKLQDSPARVRLACTSRTSEGLTAHVDHFLLRLPRPSY